MKKSSINNFQHVLSGGHFVAFIYSWNAGSLLALTAVAASFIGTYVINAVLWDRAT